MKLLDLFAGIGGFSLAAHWMGWETVAFVEKDKFCQKVLRKNFGQDIEIYDDIITFDAKPYRESTDIVCGGFPCQPYSLAGKRKGTADNRHLWPEMLRTVGESKPDYVVGENVFGLTNWSDGLVFEQVQADLEDIGYEVWAGILPAAGINAPHRRDRVWFVANAKHDGTLRRSGQISRTSGKERLQERHKIQRPFESIGLWTDTIPNINGVQRCEDIRGIRSCWANGNEQPLRLLRPTWEKFPTQPAVCGRNDGIPDRVDRIRSLGNAIVPQIAFEIFKAIEATEQL